VAPEDAAALGAAMCQLLENPDAARRMGDSARQHVRNHHEIDAMVRQYEQIYKGLLAANQ
jgi:glycosyltransferase involved in cell wall biosynthesis